MSSHSNPRYRGAATAPSLSTAYPAPHALLRAGAARHSFVLTAAEGHP